MPENGIASQRQRRNVQSSPVQSSPVQSSSLASGNGHELVHVNVREARPSWHQASVLPRGGG
ncbi:hypothetical protein CCMA1212_006673 [Trichoderma ghanense]|uniref:Uncharacterized protein n=1 Tax=Trichoderma ghanense TaxID=65468 RepID=A0ABY2H2R2_9HYPO